MGMLKRAWKDVHFIVPIPSHKWCVRDGCYCPFHRKGKKGEACDVCIFFYSNLHLDGKGPLKCTRCLEKKGG